MLKTRLSDHDVERLLCGKSPESKALRPLAPLLSSFHVLSWPAPDAEAVARFASEAATIARSVKSSVVVTTAGPARRSRFLAPAIKRGLATGMAGALLVSGLTGVAVASDDAVPGDFLYGLDRALESVGVGAGGAAERIAEARALLEAGNLADAISHASRAVDGLGDGEFAELSIETANRADALRSAATKVGSVDNGSASAEVRAAVSAMLNEIAARVSGTTPAGTSPGQGVAEIARMNGGNGTSSTGPEDARTGQPEHGTSEPGQSGSENSDQASTPPSGDPPAADDSSTAPSDPPGKSGEAPGKADSPPGKSDGKPASPQSRP